MQYISEEKVEEEKKIEKQITRTLLLLSCFFGVIVYKLTSTHVSESVGQ